MATRATAAVPTVPLEGGRRSRRVQDALATYGLTTPALVLLIVFFLLPIYFIVRFSLGLERFAATEAAAEITGELADFSTQLWSEFLSLGVDVQLLGKDNLSAHVPTWVVGVVFAALVVGAVAGRRLSERYGGWIQIGSLVLLLIPFLTIPAGNNLLRLAELSSEGDFLRLFFRSVSMATTSSIWAVIIAFPIAYFLAFGIKKSKYTWLLIVIAPFLTSYLLRIFAWKVILGDQGLINSAFFEAGAAGSGQSPSRSSSTASSRSFSCCSTPGCRSSSCRSSSRSRTWTGACSRRRPISVPAGSARCAR